MKQIAFIIMSLTLACGGSTSQEAPITTSDAGPSLCVLPSKGGFGIPCSGKTPRNVAWVWADTSRAGEQSQWCDEVACPSGATCLVQSDLSGKDDGGEILMGVCQ